MERRRRLCQRVREKVVCKRRELKVLRREREDGEDDDLCRRVYERRRKRKVTV